jgi:hypothetical protein
MSLRRQYSATVKALRINLIGRIFTHCRASLRGSAVHIECCHSRSINETLTLKYSADAINAITPKSLAGLSLSLSFQRL